METGTPGMYTCVSQIEGAIVIKATRISLAAILAVLLISPALANTSTDFEGFAIGTPAESLTVPSVTFSGGGAFEIEDTAVLGFSLDGQVLFSPSCGTPLTIQFDSPQNSVTVDYALAGNPLEITALNAGSVAAQQNFNGTVVDSFPQGTASLTVIFDELVISAPNASDCLAIDNLSTTSASVPVPTLSLWALMLMALLVAAIGWIGVRRSV